MLIYRFGGYTTVGVRKEANQDAYCFVVADTSFGEIALAVICDGVGGLRDGELASSVVTQRFQKWFEQDFPLFAASNIEAGMVDLVAMKQAWADLLGRVNDEILSYGRQHDVTLGTTFTGLLLCQGNCLIGHVGDCRAYRVRQGALEVLTTDQTYVAREIARGNMTPEEALMHPKRNMLLQAVGSQQELSPAFRILNYSPEDLFVLCCDGLYRSVDPDRMRNAFSQLVYANEGEMEQACQVLAQLAIEGGSTDNITLLCFTSAPLAVPNRRGVAYEYTGAESTTTLSEMGGKDIPGGIDAPTTTLGGLDAPTTTLGGGDAPTTSLGADKGEEGVVVQGNVSQRYEDGI